MTLTRGELRELQQLARPDNIIMCQETRLDELGGYSALETALPTHKIIYNNSTDHKGGTVILVGSAVCWHYHIKSTPLPRGLQGVAQCLHFEGKQRDNLSPLPFRLLNVYLATGDNHHVRRAHQIKLLRAIPNDTHLVVGGDFNFVENHEDTTNYSRYHELKKGARKHWNRFIHKHNLWEVSQDIHTNIATNTVNPQDSRTSRIDRFYITHDEADCALYTPETHVVNTNYSILNTTSPDLTIKSKPHISTHMALALTFHSTSDTKGHHAYRLPPWVDRTPAFQDIFRR